MNKRFSIKMLTACTAMLSAALFDPPSAKANLIPITGSISFGSLGVTVNNANLADATSFSLKGAFTTSTSGDYSSVPPLTPVSFTGFTFSPVANLPTMWSFKVGSDTYSLDDTSGTASYDSVHHQWDIGGTGMLEIGGVGTDFAPTTAAWTANLSQSGRVLGFDATAAAVSDTAYSMPLLGAAFFGLMGVRHKLCV